MQASTYTPPTTATWSTPHQPMENWTPRSRTRLDTYAGSSNSTRDILRLLFRRSLDELFLLLLLLLPLVHPVCHSIPLQKVFISTRSSVSILVRVFFLVFFLLETGTNCDWWNSKCYLGSDLNIDFMFEWKDVDTNIYIYIFIYIIHRYFRNAILKRNNKSVTVREKEVHGKYLYSHERGLVDRIISHRGKEGSVVSQRVSHWDLSLKKERKERKTIDFHFIPPLPLSFSFKFIFPSILPRIHQEFLTFRGSDFRGMRWIDFSFFVLAFTNRVNHAIDPQQWFSSYIQKEKRKKSSWIFFWIDAYLLIDRTENIGCSIRGS